MRVIIPATAVVLALLLSGAASLARAEAPVVPCGTLAAEKLPQTRQTKPLHDYMGRIFQMESFRASLSEQEIEMRPTRAA